MEVNSNNNKLNAQGNITHITIPQVSRDPASITGLNDVHRSQSALMDDEKKVGFLRNCMKADTIDFITKVLAEFIGTGLLLFLGCMGCVKGLLDDDHGAHLNGGLGFGFVVMIIIIIFGCVSGAHLNPSVTIASIIYNLISLPLAGAFIVAQILGAFTGFGLLKAMTSINLAATNGSTGMCTTALHESVSPAQGFIIEFVITGVLILVCCGVWDPRNAKETDSIPIKFGLTVAGISIVAGPFTGASMNPARSLAPAVWNGYLVHQWIYWIGPLSGAIITAFLYKQIFRREVPAPVAKPFEEYPLACEKQSR